MNSGTVGKEQNYFITRIKLRVLHINRNAGTKHTWTTRLSILLNISHNYN